MSNFSWVIEGKLAGLAFPYGDKDFSILAQNGIQVLINLTGYVDEYYKASALNSNIQTIDIPIADFQAPSVETADKIIASIQAALTADKAVAVHCQMGNGRTGLTLAYYLMKVDGLSPDEAIKKIRELRPGAIETKTQKDFLISCWK